MKQLSLKKTIIWVVLVAYIAMLVLLLGIDSYLVRNHQMDMQEKKESAATEVFGEISANMQNISRALYDFYLKDEHFLRLSGELVEGTEYSYAYEVRESAITLMDMQDGWDAFYLYYNNGSDSLYHIDTDHMPAEDGSRIYQALQTLSYAEKEMAKTPWFVLTLEEQSYLVMGMQKGRAEIYGLMNLTNAEQAVKETSGLKAALCLVDGMMAQTNTELCQILGLDEKSRGAGRALVFREKGFYVCGERLDNSDIWAIAAYPLGVGDYVNFWQILMLLLTILSVVTVIYVYRFLKNNLVTELDDLKLKMEAIRRNSNNRRLTLNARFTEIQEVGATLDIMVDELEKQKLKTYEEYIEKQKSQMQFLQLQMKPHFYLNGLKAINALVLNGSKEDVRELILGLSEHFRYLLYQETETVPLAKEISFTENYCRTVGQMSGRKVGMDVNVPDRLKSIPVPVLILQTFVENSVKYARTGGADVPLVITVDACRLEMETGDMLDLSIRDNGNGYDQEVLREIQKADDNGKSHIGIRNLISRLRILYGDAAEFSFWNQDGACSEIIIPCESGEVTGQEEGRNYGSITCG